MNFPYLSKGQCSMFGFNEEMVVARRVYVQYLDRTDTSNGIKSWFVIRKRLRVLKEDRIYGSRE